MSESIYPNAIDGYAQLPLVIDTVTRVDAISVNRLRCAIVNIENELGVLPSGSFPTVRARLDAIEAAIGGAGGIDIDALIQEVAQLRIDVDALQDELGDNPSGVFITVEERLDDLQIQIDNITGDVLPPLNDEQYSMLMEDPASDLIFQRVRQVMIIPDMEITSLSLTSGSLIEVGDILNNPSFTAAYTVTPSTATVIDDQANPILDITGTPTSFTYSHSYVKSSYGAQVDWTVYAEDESFSNDTRIVTKTWAQKVFWGVDVAGGSTEAFIEALSNSALATTKNRTFSVTAGGAEKIYYAYRSGFGDATFTVGGFDGGFFKVSDTISVTNSFGFTENYTLYESDNLGLGSTTVVVT
jgi:hypothetical protein